MRLKSTGLGATELFGDLTGMEKNMTGVLMLVKINKPVVWRVRVLLQQKDLRKLILMLLKPANVWFMIKALLFNPKPEAQVTNQAEAKKRSRVLHTEVMIRMEV